MTIFALQEKFRTELGPIYSASEINELFVIFSEKYLGLSKIELRTGMDEQLSAEQEVLFDEALRNLHLGMPYQQILGEADFFSQKFVIDKHVLIPRPETEELLELAIQQIKNSELNMFPLRILDIGTGSGIIPIILKKHFPLATVEAIDFSENALKIAKLNAEKHETDIHFIFGDYLSLELKENYDIIISNPPYISIDEAIEIDNSVKDFEPKMALFSPHQDALVFYRKIAEDAKTNLNENGFIFLEINQKLGAETLQLFEEFPKQELLKDISGNYRMILVQK